MNDPLVFSAILGTAVALVLIRLKAIDRRLNRLARLDAKVDALLQKSGIDFDEYRDVPADVREAIERGERILAIKRFRQATGVDLKEAKEMVDEIRRRRMVRS